ncbi:MAG TPA: TonB-dependent receptor, partial [Verrucomicrobiae bacterium]
RIEPTKNLSFDVAAFFNAYDNVIQFEPGAPRFEATPAPPHLLLPQNATNALSGSSYGVELAVQFRVSEHWRLAADYSWLHLRFLGASSGFDSPEQQVRLRSYVDLPWNLEFNSAISYVDTLRDQQVPSYVRLDLGLVWRPTKSLEVGVWGQNLLDGRHPEFPADITTLQTEVPRSVLGKMTWRF